MYSFQDGKDGNGDNLDLESDCKTSSDSLSGAGEKRKYSMNEEDTVYQQLNSPKKRKIANGQSMPIKTDKKSRDDVLRLLKQRMNRKRSVSHSRSLRSTQSSSSSSSSVSTPTSKSRWSHPHINTVNKNINLRRINANKFIGRRSHTLKLAAKSSLNTSPQRIVCLLFFLILLNIP